VAARAKEKLPQAVNGRVESAVKLVLAHDVTPQADGTILVGSSADPLKTYRLEGTTCTCQDFQYGKAPDGWCSHRIAAGIQKRVREVLATPAVEPATAQESGHPALPEAPASVNVRLTLHGREVQLTLRDHDEGRLLVRLEEVLQRYPLPQSQPQLSPQQHNAAAMHRPVTGFCQVHNVPMRWNEGKEGRKGWYSHKTEDGQWCQGRARG